MTQSLPARPSLEFLKKEAKRLYRRWQQSEEEALRLLRAHHPRADSANHSKRSLADAQLVLARNYGFTSWPQLKRAVTQALVVTDRHERAFVEWSLTNKSLPQAETLLRYHPEIATADLWCGCVSGAADDVLARLEREPKLATRRGGPRGWPPLLYVCHSRFLRCEDPPRLAIADRLLELGADANAYFRVNQDPNARQTALYGAAGIARNPRLTALLLSAGADPNDRAPGLGPESLYHASESSDLSCLRLLLEARPERDKVSYCLGRKLDFEDPPGVRLFLEHGADPNFTRPGDHRGSRLHGAIERRRSAEIIGMLLDHGADVVGRSPQGFTPLQLATRNGSFEVAELLRERGANPADVTAMDHFLGACSRADPIAMRTALEQDSDLLDRLTPADQELLPQAAMHGDVAAVVAMLELGWDITVGADQRMTCLHWAAWHGHAELVREILRFDPPLTPKNVYGGTALDTAVYGATHCEEPQAAGSMPRRPGYEQVVTLLIAAGADAGEVHPFPTGHQRLDVLLAEHRSDRALPPIPPVHDHVRASEAFHRQFVVSPTEPAPLVEHLDAQAEALVRAHEERSPDAAVVIQLTRMPGQRLTLDEILATELTLPQAREVIAQTYQFPDWSSVSTRSELVDPELELAVDAVVSGDTLSLETLLRRRPQLIGMRSAFAHRSTLLHYTAANGVEIRRQQTPRNVTEVVQVLLEFGAEVDALAESYGGGAGQTTLCLAVSSGHPADAQLQVPLVESLVAGGAEVNGIDNDGLPLATALSFGYQETAQRLATLGARVDNVVVAAGLGHFRTLQSLLEKMQQGQWAAYRDPFGELLQEPQALKDKALFVASQTGSVEAVELLIVRGAEVQYAPRHGQTALHWAAYAGRRDIVQCLVAHGANTRQRDAQWDTKPIGWAAEGGRRDVVAFLADVSDLDLPESVEVGWLPATRELLGDAHPDTAVVPESPGELLRSAVRNGHAEIVRFLLARHADPHLAGKDGRSALALAEGNTDLLAIFQSFE